MEVAHLAAEVDEATLGEAFSTCGPVAAVSVFRDQATGQRRVLAPNASASHTCAQPRPQPAPF